jgi:hypothetical protein
MTSLRTMGSNASPDDDGRYMAASKHKAYVLPAVGDAWRDFPLHGQLAQGYFPLYHMHKPYAAQVSGHVSSCHAGLFHRLWLC